MRNHERDDHQTYRYETRAKYNYREIPISLTNVIWTCKQSLGQKLSPYKKDYPYSISCEKLCLQYRNSTVTRNHDDCEVHDQNKTRRVKLSNRISFMIECMCVIEIYFCNVIVNLIRSTRIFIKRAHDVTKARTRKAQKIIKSMNATEIIVNFTNVPGGTFLMRIVHY